MCALCFSLWWRKKSWIFTVSELFLGLTLILIIPLFLFSLFLPLFTPSPLPLPSHSGGGGRVGHDAGTDTWPFAGGGLPSQSGPTGGHLGHHAHRSTQAGWLPPAGHHAVSAALPGQAGEAAVGHQDRGEEEEKRGNRVCETWMSWEN